MPSITWNQERWNRTFPWDAAGDEWSTGFGGTPQMWAGAILPRIVRFLPAKHILEIGPGFGRVTQYLVRYAQRLTAVDLAPNCVRICKDRFRGFPIRTHLNDGRSLSMVKDGSVNFVFSWDSLVHAEVDVMTGYLVQLGRKLIAGGAGFIHHSNMNAFLDDRGESTVPNEHWRASTVSAMNFRKAAQDAGLVILRQEILPWGGSVLNDCISCFCRPPAGTPAEAFVQPEPVVNEAFWAESRQVAAISDAYGAAWRRAFNASGSSSAALASG